MINGLASAFGYTASTTATKFLADGRAATGGRDTDRQQTAALVRRVMSGDGLEDDVTAALQRRYHPDTFRQLKFDQGVATHNRLMQDVVGRLAVEWQDGADYTLTDSAGEDVAEDLLRGFLDALGVDNIMREVGRLVRVHPAVLVMPAAVFDEATGTRLAKLCIYTPEHVTLLPSKENHTGFAGFVVSSEYTDEKGKEIGRRVRWTKYDVTEWVAKEAGRWVQTLNAPNPYGLLPGTLFRMGAPVHCPWVDNFGEMLAEKTIEANCWETLLGFKGSSQVKVLGGPLTAWPQGQVLRDAGIVNFGEASNASVLDFQTDLAGFAEVMIERLRRQACLGVGLGLDEFDQTGTPPSGESLKLRYFKRDQQARMVRGHLVESLRQLYWVALTVLWHETARTGGDVARISNLPAQLPPYVADDPLAFTFRVDPREVTYPELAAEYQAQTDWKLAKGLIARTDLMRRENPDLDHEGAEAAVRGNLIAEAEFNNPGRMALEVRRKAAVEALKGGVPE
jgi:hypothetical protein